jgi:hypothetical protein
MILKRPWPMGSHVLRVLDEAAPPRHLIKNSCALVFLLASSVMIFFQELVCLVPYWTAR